MIFRILNNKLYKVNVRQSDESNFIAMQAGGKVEYLVVRQSDLPTIKDGYPKFYKIDKNGKIAPDHDRIYNKLSNNLLESVQKIADAKTVNAKAYLAGKTYVSPEQQERYQRKYDVAKAYLDTKDDHLKALLAPEADGAGMSVDDLAALIVQMGDRWRQAVQAYAVMIDGARVALNKLIEAGRLDGVQMALDELSALGADATPDEIKTIIDKASG